MDLVSILVFDVDVDDPCQRLGGYSMACLEGTTFGNDFGILMPSFWMDLVTLD